MDGIRGAFPWMATLVQSSGLCRAEVKERLVSRLLVRAKVPGKEKSGVPQGRVGAQRGSTQGWQDVPALAVTTKNERTWDNSGGQTTYLLLPPLLRGLELKPQCTLGRHSD